MGAAKNARKAQRKVSRREDRRPYIFDIETLPSFRPGGKFSDWLQRVRTVSFLDPRCGRNVDGPKVIDLNREELSKLWQAESKTLKLYVADEHDPAKKGITFDIETDAGGSNPFAYPSLGNFSDVWRERLANVAKNGAFKDLYLGHFPTPARHRSIGAPATNSIRGLDFSYAILDEVVPTQRHWTHTSRTSSTSASEAREQVENLYNIDFSKIEQRLMAHFVDRFTYGPELKRLERLCKRALYMRQYGAQRWEIKDLFDREYDAEHMAVIRDFVYRGVRIGDII